MLKRTRWFFISSFIVMMTVIFSSNSLAEKPKGEEKTKSLQRVSASVPLFQVMNINNISAWYKSNGNGSMPPSESGDGVVFPRLTGSAIYEDGFMWGGMVYLDAAKTIGGNKGQTVRVGGNEYVQGNQPGPVAGSGGTATLVDSAQVKQWIYRIRRDWLEMSQSELKQDAAETNETSPSAATAAMMNAVLAQYENDWYNWPYAYGAPYIERNGVPGYQKPPKFNYDKNSGPLFTMDSLISGKYDEPGVAGADPNVPASQVIWAVFNDLNRSLTTALYGSEPMGIETQVTLWGYKRTDALGNLVFKRARFINKGGVDTSSSSTRKQGQFTIDSMYVAQWSDPDLGNAGDDILGCDTSLGLGYVYNGLAIDNEYKGFNLPPPSSGYDFLAGPIVAGSPTDKAVFDLKYRTGKKNLAMTSFSYFSAGSALSDPRPRNYAIGTDRWWKMLRGYAPQDGPAILYPFPPNVTPSKFPFAGDPVAGTGFLDGKGQTYSFSPGDRRLIMSSGPFTLAAGDTQDVVVALVVGIGADRLSSVSAIKFNDSFVQAVFNDLFVLPSGLAPSLTYAELDRKVVLDWGWDDVKIQKTEDVISNPGAFVFEGYNIYQLPTSGADLSFGKRVTTFDKINDYSILMDKSLDLASGKEVTKPVQFGSNSGIQRYFVFDKDYLNDRPALNNGQDYYLAVSAYYRATDPTYPIQVLESPSARITIRPQTPVPGTVYNANVGDKIATATHKAGTSEGSVDISVVDPSKLTGHTYELSFSGSGSARTYSIKDSTQKNVLYTGGINFGTDWGGEALAYPIVEGMLVKVTDGAGPSQSAQWTGVSGAPKWIQGRASFTDDPYAGVDDGFIPGASTPDYFGQFGPSYKLQDSYPIEFRFDDSLKVDTLARRQKAYRFVRHNDFTNNVFLLGGGITPSAAPIDTPKARADTLRFVTVPFTVWDMSNPSSPRQLAVGFRDGANGTAGSPYNNANGSYALAGTEYIWVYNKTYNDSMNQFTRVGNNGTGGPNADIVYLGRFTLVTGKRSGSGKGALSVVPKIKMSSSDVYAFSDPTKAVVKGNIAAAKQDAAKVNVFPNPYYAYNPAETNRFSKFVTFSHLPANATVRIFNLAGQQVKVIKKDGALNSTQFERWDLNNDYGFPVASGIYIAYIDMPDLGMTKILKLAIIQEQEVLETY